MEDYHVTLDLLESMDAELKLVIAGNHDLTLDSENWAHSRREYLEHDHARALAIWKGDRARNAGVRYLEEGLHEFTLRSGVSFTVYASPYQPEFGNWAFMYKDHEDRYNPSPSLLDKVRNPSLRTVNNIATSPIPDFPAVDILMTHGPPAGHLDLTKRGVQVGCPHLLRAVQRARPRIHCFGHIHEAWGAETVEWGTNGQDNHTTPATVSKRGDGDGQVAALDLTGAEEKVQLFGTRTTMINACILDVHHNASRIPWLVELDLPIK